jgi:hypothetical protein
MAQKVSSRADQSTASYESHKQAQETDAIKKAAAEKAARELEQSKQKAQQEAKEKALEEQEKNLKVAQQIENSSATRAGTKPEKIVAASAASDTHLPHIVLVQTRPQKTDSTSGNQKTSSDNPISQDDSRSKPQQRQSNTNSAQPQMSTEALGTTTKQLHEALGKEHWFFDPRKGDDDKVLSLLKRYSPEERQRIVDNYNQRYNNSFTSDINSQLNQDNGKEVHAILQKNEQARNLAELQNKLEKINQSANTEATCNTVKLATTILPGAGLIADYQSNEANKEKTAAQREIRQQLSIMNSQQLALLNKESVDTTGKTLAQLISDNQQISAENKEVIQLYLTKGIDGISSGDRQHIFNCALQARDLDMLQESLSGSSQARDQIKAKGGEQLIKRVFTDPEQQRQALDYLASGKETLNTQVDQSRGLFGTDKKSVQEAINSIDREQKYLYLQGRTASAKDGTALSESDRQAMDYYNRINQQLETSFSQKDAAELKASLAYGESSLIPRLIKAHSDGFFGLGASTDHNQVSSIIESLPQDEWQRLRTDSSYRREVEQAMGTFLNDDEKKQAVALLTRKVYSLSDYQSAQAVRRTLSETIEDNKGGIFSHANSRNIIEALGNLSQQELTQLKTDAGYREQVNSKLKAVLDGPELDLASRLLQRAASGGETKLTAIDRVELNKLTNAGLAETTRQIEAAFKENPALLAQINTPRTDEDRRVKNLLESSLYSAAGNSPEVQASTSEEIQAATQAVYDRYAANLLKDGRLTLDQKLSLSDSRSQSVTEVINSSPEDRARLLNQNPGSKETEAFQKAIFSHFSPEEKQVIINGLRQGSLDQIDTVRTLLLDKERTPEQLTKLEDSLRSMSSQEKNKLFNDYASKYNCDFGSDLLEAVSKEDKQQVEDLLRLNRLTDRDALAELQSQRRSNESGLLGDVNYGSKFIAIDSLNDYRTAAQMASSQFIDLPPAVQERYISQANRALNTWRDARSQTADQVTDGAIVVGALTATVVTGGGASPLLIAAVGTAGGLTKVAGKELLLGDQYSSNSPQTFAGDFSSGLVNSVGMFVGPQELAAVFKVGDRIAAETSTKIVSSLAREAVDLGQTALVKEGSEKVLQAQLATLYRDAITSGSTTVDKKALTELARSVATEGNEKIVEQTLINTLRESRPSQLGSVATELGLNGLTGSLANATGEATQGLINWDPNLSTERNLKSISERTESGLVTGFSSGVIGTVALKGLGHSLSFLREKTGELAPLLERRAAQSVPGEAVVHPEFMSNAEVSPLPNLLREGTFVESKVIVKPEYASITPEVANEKLAHLNLQDFNDFSYQVLTRRNQEFIRYRAGKDGPEILIEKEYEPVLENWRRIRQEAAAKPNDPALRMQKAAIEGVLLPEDIAAHLEKLPDQGKGIKAIYLRDEGYSPQDLWNSIDKQRRIDAGTNWDPNDTSPGFRSSANASISDSVLNIYTGTRASYALNTIRHEWAHIEEGIERESRSAFDLAVSLEKAEDRFNNDNYYALRDNHENWAVNLGENVLDTSSSKYLDIIDHVKDTSSAAKYWVLLHALGNTVERSRFGLPEKTTEELSKIMARISYAEHMLYPRAEQQLTGILKSSTATGEQKMAAFNILSKTGQAAALPDMVAYSNGLTLKELADTNALVNLTKMNLDENLSASIPPVISSRLEATLRSKSVTAEEKLEVMRLFAQAKIKPSNEAIAEVTEVASLKQLQESDFIASLKDADMRSHKKTNHPGGLLKSEAAGYSFELPEPIMNKINKVLNDPEADSKEIDSAVSILSQVGGKQSTDSLIKYIQSVPIERYNAANLHFYDGYPHGVPLDLAEAIFSRETQASSQDAFATEGIVHQWLNKSSEQGRERVVQLIEDGTLTQLWKDGKFSFGKGLLLHAITEAEPGKEELLFDLVFKQLADNPTLQNEILEHCKNYSKLDESFLQQYE